MSKRDRRDDRGRDRDRDRDRRDSQPDDEGQRRSGEAEIQESESLTALKAILSKVAGLLNPLQLSQEESIRLVEQLYGGVLAMDVMLAGEADDTRKQSVLAHIQNTTITRQGDKITVEYPSARKAAPESAPAQTTGETPREATTDTAGTPHGASPGATPSAPLNPAPGTPRPVEEVEARTAQPVRPRPAGAGRPPAGRRKPADDATAPTAELHEPKTSEPAPPDSGPPED